MSPFPDSTIPAGKYAFTEELQRTERTVLYRGHRRDDGASLLARAVAGEHPSPEDLARLRHEHHLLAELDVEGVVHARDLEEHGHALVLILEDPGGKPLRAVLQAGKVLLGTALRVAASIAEILDDIHQRHVIHKDVRPENVLVHPETGRAFLMGFGSATRLSREALPIASVDSMEGSLAYVSPEQTGRMNRILDRRTDLYSLGVTLYEMLTGTTPFVAADPMELMHGHLARTPVSPRDREPRIPGVVSDIVMKLLSKAAEDRYQRAASLAVDLRECSAQWESARAITPFALAVHDRGVLRIPQKLYGRDAELCSLIDAWDRARCGATLMFLISGYSGIGKSVLVHELHREIAGARGYFIAGKFDQLNRSVPYAPIARAFQDLIHQILAEREDALETWRSRIAAAVSPNGKVLVEVIPDLALLIGPQPDVPELSPSASQRRFALVFEAFVRVTATAEHPLVLFLDDLQWADPASLALIQLMMTAPDGGHLLLIGAYRSNEVDAAHPLLLTLRDIKETAASRVLPAIELRPLGRPDVKRFVADTLGAEPERVEPLARVVSDKTQGNPFFLIQFLAALHKDGLLTFDAAAGAFSWDLDAICARTATDNVISFMSGRIQRLSPRTVHALELGACIGHRFDLRTLATIREAPPAAVAAELWEALEEGILLPLGAKHRAFPGAPGPLEADADNAYRFLHDRVQQAAYSLIDEAERASVHLRIGRLLLSRAGGARGVSDDLFEIVGHMNVGARLIDDPEERRSLARLNLEAGNKAKAANAYAAAASFLADGIALLGEGGWEQDYDLTFALHLARAQCEAMAGAFEQADSLHRVLLSHAKTDLERAQVIDLRVVLYAAEGRSADALEAGLSALRLVGIEVFETEDEWKTAYEAELREMTANLAGRQIADLVDAPEMTDPLKRTILRLFLNMTGAAFGLRPNLSTWIIVKPVNLSLRYGNSIESAGIFALHGANLANQLSRYEEGYAFARLGLALHEKHGGGSGAAMLLYFTGNAAHYSVHWRRALEHYERGYAAGMAAGDFIPVSYLSSHSMIARIALGDPLTVVREEVERRIALTERTKVSSSNAMLKAARQMIDSLLGRTFGQGTLSSPDFDEESFAAWIEAKGFKTPASWYCTVKGELAFLYEDYESAAALLTRALELGSLNFTSEIRYYASLAILALRPRASEAERQRLAPVLARCRDELAAAAAGCEENYLHKHLLVQAEAARVAEEHDRAAELYDAAIAAAQRNEWPRDVALASELCAKFYLARGRARVARAYMADASYAYAQWGAVAKVRQLAERYPTLVPVETQSPLPSVRPPASRASPDRMDTIAFIRALQTLAGELVLLNVLDQLMRIVLQNSGAQRGFLLLDRDGALVIEAAATDADGVRVELGVPLDESADLAVSVVRYADRVKEAVVIGEATRDSRFASDPYIAARRPRSIACLSMTHQGRSRGLLYLESNAAANAFTPERVDLLALLLSQAAISVDNAALLSRLQAVTAELLRSKEALERSNEELVHANARLSQELVERRRSDELRFELQAEIVRVQAEKLLELSTPLLPIAAGVLVMPLIGSIDATRAAQMLETALEGVRARRANVVLFDITGVREADAAVAETLVRIATALRLLGAETVLTGMQPEVARALVQLGSSFKGVVAEASLESGVAYALARRRRSRH